MPSKDTTKSNITPTSSSSRQKDSKKFSNHFLVNILSSVHGSVTARLPEEIQFQISSEWDNILSGGGGGPFSLVLSEIAGISTRNEFSSAQTWSGNSPIEITIPLEFYAEDDPKIEVVNPVIKLAKMTLPRKNGSVSTTIGDIGLFTPPGPRIFDIGTAANDQITIQVGNFMRFDKVIILSVNPTFVTREMAPNGLPLKSSCDITFRSMFSLTGESLEEMFNV